MNERYRIVLRTLVFVSVLAISFVSALAAYGEVAGNVYSSDILTTLNGVPIPSYNIDGKTAIVSGFANQHAQSLNENAYSMEIYTQPQTNICVQDMFSSSEILIILEGNPEYITVYPYGEITGSNGFASYVIYIEDTYTVEQSENFLRISFENEFLTKNSLPVNMEITQVANVTVEEMVDLILADDVFDGSEPGGIDFWGDYANEHFILHNYGYANLNISGISFNDSLTNPYVVFSSETGLAWDDTWKNLIIRDNGRGGVFLITIEIFAEAYEGHGSRFLQYIRNMEILITEPEIMSLQLSQSHHLIVQNIADFLIEKYPGFFTGEIMVEEFSEGMVINDDGEKVERMYPYTAAWFSIGTPRDTIENMPRVLVKFTDAGSGPTMVYQFVDGKYQRTEESSVGRPHTGFEDLKSQVYELINQKLWPNFITLPNGTVVDTDISVELIDLVFTAFDDIEPQNFILSIRNSLISDDVLRIETISQNLESTYVERHWMKIKGDGENWVITGHQMGDWYWGNYFNDDLTGVTWWDYGCWLDDCIICKCR